MGRRHRCRRRSKPKCCNWRREVTGLHRLWSHSFDIVFLDAIKSEYRRYLDLALPKLRPGGLLIADNVLWGGRIARGEHDADADALRAFNAYAMAHPELHAIILPLGDGVLYAAKRDTPAGG